MKETKEGKNRQIELTLHPVGVVRSPLKVPLNRGMDQSRSAEEQREEIRARMHLITELVSELVILPDLQGLLDGIEEFSHIVVLFWPHLIPEERRGLVHVHPMGLAHLPEVGIFATRSPARPNPVLISTVSLLERNGNILKVQGLEAVDGSPIIDVKPFVDVYPAIKESRFPEWLRSVVAAER